MEFSYEDDVDRIPGRRIKYPGYVDRELINEFKNTYQI